MAAGVAKPHRRRRRHASGTHLLQPGADVQGTLGYLSPAGQLEAWRQGRLERIGAPAPRNGPKDSARSRSDRWDVGGTRADLAFPAESVAHKQGE